MKFVVYLRVDERQKEEKQIAHRLLKQDHNYRSSYANKVAVEKG